jgi:hypothetical protein
MYAKTCCARHCETITKLCPYIFAYMIRKTENWLKFYVTKKIKQLYPQLVIDINSQKNEDWFVSKFNRKKWYNSILASLTTIFVLASIFQFTKISLEYGAFIDQRSSNLATISGMCLSVIVFLMANIAVKETYAYDLLFERTKLYPAIFFVLSTLGIFVLLSTLRNVIPIDIYSSLVVAAGFMFLFVLLIIGYLFSTVIHYINPSQIDKFMSRKLNARADEIFLAGLIKSISEERYSSVLNQQGVIRYTLSDHFDRLFFKSKMTFKSGSEVALQESKEKYVEDIDLVALANYASEIKKPAYYHMLALDQLTEQTGYYVLHPDLQTSDENRKKLKRILILKNHKISLPTVTEVRNHFDDRILSYSDSGKSAELKRLLEGIDRLYEDQMLYKTESPFDLTENFSIVLQNSLNASIEKIHFECFKLLWNFFFIKSYKAITGENFIMYGNLLWLHNVAYINGIQKKGNSAYKKILDYTLIPSNSYEMYFEAISKLVKDNPNNKHLIDDFNSKSYQCFNDLLFNMVYFGDEVSIQAAMALLQRQFKSPENFELRREISELKEQGITNVNYKNFKMLKRSYREAKSLQTLRRRMIFGIKAWVFHLIDRNAIDVKKGRDLIKYMVVRNDDWEDPLDDIFFYRGREASLGYLSWLNWSLSEVGDENQDREISSPSGWLTFGFMAEQIINNNLPLYLNDLEIDEYQFVEMLKDNLIETKEVFINDFQKWKDILNLKSLDDLKAKADHIIEFFSNLARSKEDVELKNIAEAPLDHDLVKTEIEKSAGVWYKNANVYNFFTLHGDVKKLENVSLPFLGHDGYANSMKRFFLSENNHLSILSSIANRAGRLLDDHFFSLLISNLSTVLETDSVNDFLISSAEDILNMQPDVIFADGYDLLMDDGLRNNNKFRPRNLGNEANEDLKIFGWYDSIPIYMVPVSSFINKVAIANLKKAFVMEYNSDETLHNGVLKIEVRAIDRNEAEDIFNRRYSISISEEFKKKKIFEIQNDIHITLGANIAFRITNQNAFKIGIIKPKRENNLSLLN